MSTHIIMVAVPAAATTSVEYQWAKGGSRSHEQVYCVPSHRLPGPCWCLFMAAILALAGDPDQCVTELVDVADRFNGMPPAELGSPRLRLVHR